MQIASNMQRIIQIIDVITILSSISNLAYCAADIGRIELYSDSLWVLMSLSLLIRVFRFTDQRWQLVADRMVISTLVIQPLAECHEYGLSSADDLYKFLFALVLNSSIILVRGRLFRVLLSMPVLPMFIGIVLNVPEAPILLLTSAVGCIWREHLTATSPIQI